MTIKELSHSQFIVYMRQIKSGMSHEEALKYSLNNGLNIGEYIYNNISK